MAEDVIANTAFAPCLSLCRVNHKTASKQKLQMHVVAAIVCQCVHEGTCFSHVHVRGQRPVLSAFPNAPRIQCGVLMESQEIGLSSICFGSGLEETLPLLPTPSHHSPPIPAVSCCSDPPHPTPSLVHPCSHPIMEAYCTEPLPLHVIQSFPLRCRNAGLDVSRVLSKVAACTIPAAAGIQHGAVYHPNRVERNAQEQHGYGLIY